MRSSLAAHMIRLPTVGVPSPLTAPRMSILKHHTRLKDSFCLVEKQREEHTSSLAALLGPPAR